MPRNRPNWNERRGHQERDWRTIPELRAAVGGLKAEIRSAGPSEVDELRAELAATEELLDERVRKQERLKYLVDHQATPRGDRIGFGGGQPTSTDPDHRNTPTRDWTDAPFVRESRDRALRAVDSLDLQPEAGDRLVDVIDRD